MNKKNHNLFLGRLSSRGPQSGVSLAEVMVCVLIFGLVALGLFRLFVYCSAQADLARNITLALAEAQDQMEEMRAHSFNQLTADYADGGTPGDDFTLTQVNGKGVVTIDAANPKLLKVRIAVCWRNQSGRVIGEDADLDGTLTTAEDIDADGVLDSLVVVESFIAEL